MFASLVTDEPNDSSKAIAKRAKSFDANNWLRANQFNHDFGELNPVVECSTISAPFINADIAFKAPAVTAPRISGFISEQEFEGLVETIDPNQKYFWARLVDTTGGMPDEEAEFSFLEVSQDDWSLIVPGALFSWNIGLESRNKQMRRVSEIRFRRFFKFSKDTIKKAEQRADSLISLIGEINYSD